MAKSQSFATNGVSTRRQWKKCETNVAAQIWQKYKSGSHDPEVSEMAAVLAQDHGLTFQSCGRCLYHCRPNNLDLILFSFLQRQSLFCVKVLQLSQVKNTWASPDWTIAPAKWSRASSPPSGKGGQQVASGGFTTWSKHGRQNLPPWAGHNRHLSFLQQGLAAPSLVLVHLVHLVHLVAPSLVPLGNLPL